MALRYNNDKSALLRELEENQGNTYFPSHIYVHTDKKGFKRLYMLSPLQRVFMFFEDPKFSKVGAFFGSFMLAVIIFNLVVFIISSLQTFKYTPDTCATAACDHTALCPGQKICEPIADEWTRVAELVCVAIFTFEYMSRLVLVWVMPPRLSDVLIKPQQKEQSMSSIFTSNKPSAKDELFAHVKLALADSEHELHHLVRPQRKESTVMSSNTKFELNTETDSASATNGGAVTVTRLIDEHDDGESFQLSDMNVPVSIVDSSTSFVDPAHQKLEGGRLDKQLSKRSKGAAKTFNFGKNDALADLDRKSRAMDKSHKYSWYFKTFSYFRKTLNLIDLIAILPFYIESLVSRESSTQLSIIRVLRLARVFRIFKMGKGNAGVHMLGTTIYVSMPALSLLSFFILLGVILFGALIYFIEGGVFTVNAEYPGGAYLIDGFFGELVRTTYTSIVSAIYWAVVVTTTTGYGDMVPFSFAGKLVAILCAYYGFLLLALPITVIGNNFDKILNAQQGRDNEQFIYECLVGITRSIDVEYRARAKLAPVPSNAYKMTLVTAIISTFDSTKQTLLKDSILAANRTANSKRREDMASNQEAREADTSSKPVDARRRASWVHDTDAAIHETQSASSHSIGKEEAPSEDKPAGIFTAATMKDQMAGISWDRMPNMPAKKTNKSHFQSSTHTRIGKTAQEELRLASEEMRAATAEWEKLFDSETMREMLGDTYV